MNHVRTTKMSTTWTHSRPGEPTWELAREFPLQGDWTVEEYLDLDTNRYVEYTAGRLEFLPMPTDPHQAMVLFLCGCLISYLQKSRRFKGRVRPGPLAVQVRSDKYRQPDVVFMLKANEKRCHVKYWEGADLVMEIVSPGKRNRERDFKTKRRDYARAGISEYWVVSPKLLQITVLVLDGSRYRVQSEHGAGQTAKSLLLTGFQVAVNDVFAAGGLKPPAA
jgi:Uma2 family endonuclease